MIILLYMLGFIVSSVLGLRYYSHMLQLSSYQFQGYFRSLKKDARKLFLHAVLLAMYLFTVVSSIRTSLESFEEITGALIFAVLILAVLGLLIWEYRIKPVKKKFVVTARVMRLFATYVVLIVLFVVAGVLISKGIGRFDVGSARYNESGAEVFVIDLFLAEFLYTAALPPRVEFLSLIHI